MPSFDVVSQVNWQEVDNAINQAAREISQRFDFRGTQSSVTLDKTTKTIQLASNSADRLDVVLSVLQSKAHKRGIDLKVFKAGKKIPAGGQIFKQDVTLTEGIDKECARLVTSRIKELDIKVQPSIQGDQLRVTGKKRDDLQEVIAALKSAPFSVPLQFINFRD